MSKHAFLDELKALPPTTAWARGIDHVGFLVLAAFGLTYRADKAPLYVPVRTSRKVSFMERWAKDAFGRVRSVIEIGGEHKDAYVQALGIAFATLLAQFCDPNVPKADRKKRALASVQSLLDGAGIGYVRDKESGAYLINPKTVTPELEDALTLAMQIAFRATGQLDVIDHGMNFSTAVAVAKARKAKAKAEADKAAQEPKPTAKASKVKIDRENPTESAASTVAFLGDGDTLAFAKSVFDRLTPEAQTEFFAYCQAKIAGRDREVVEEVAEEVAAA